MLAQDPLLLSVPDIRLSHSCPCHIFFALKSGFISKEYSGEFEFGIFDCMILVDFVTQCIDCDVNLWVYIQ